MKIYRLKPTVSEFKRVYGREEVYSLKGCLTLLEKLIDEFEKDFDEKRRRRITSNQVFIFLDKRISNMMDKIYKRGGPSSDLLDLRVKLGERVEKMADLYNSGTVKRIEARKKKEEETSHRKPMPEVEAAFLYEDAIRVRGVDFFGSYQVGTEAF